MKKFTGLNFLLFIVLVMGAFASMAQNDYGQTVLGGVATAFAVVFGIQLISVNKQNDMKSMMMELASLMMLAIILALRVFYIHFALIEFIFIAACLLLAFVYLVRVFKTFQELRYKNNYLAWMVLLFYTAITAYLLSLAIIPFLPRLAEPFGMIGFVLLIIFSFFYFSRRTTSLEGENISILSFIGKQNDQSRTLVILFLLFTFYAGLTKMDLLPKMYSNEFPQAYFELVKRAESGLESSQNGSYRHEEFKKKYELFVQRHGTLK